MIIDKLLLFLRKPRVLALILATLFSLLIYATTQQVYRQSANDPQIQIAEDTAAGLAAGMPANSLSPAPGRTIDQGLAPFVVIYDESGSPIAGSALYKGELPKPPKGVFEHAGKGQNRITWQPEKGQRYAAVITHYKGPNDSGFVMSARSLNETEDRIMELGSLVFFGWIAAVLLIIITSSRGIHHLRKIVGRKNK